MQDLKNMPQDGRRQSKWKQRTLIECNWIVATGSVYCACYSFPTQQVQSAWDWRHSLAGPIRSQNPLFHICPPLSPLPCCSHLPQKLCMPFLSNTTSSVCMRLKTQPGRANQITKPSLPYLSTSLPLALLLSPPTETVHVIPFQHNKFSMHETEDTAWQGQSDHKTLFAIFVYLSLPLALLLSPPTETALCRSPNPISPLHSCSFITAIRDYQSGHVEDIFT